MSSDLGSVAAGFNNNFAYGKLALTANDYVRLVDNAHNSAGTGPEAVYASSLLVPAGATLDLNRPAPLCPCRAPVERNRRQRVRQPASGRRPRFQFATTLTPGSPSPSPGSDGRLDLLRTGRPGRPGTRQVPGSGSLFAPLSPSLNFTQLQLVGPSGSVVATAANSVSGADAMLQAVTLPADGTYHPHASRPNTPRAIPRARGDYLSSPSGMPRSIPPPC